MVAELYSGNKNEAKYGSRDIIRERRQAVLSFLYATLGIDLFYNPTMYHSNISTVAELFSENQNDEKIWIKKYK